MKKTFFLGLMIFLASGMAEAQDRYTGEIAVKYKELPFSFVNSQGESKTKNPELRPVHKKTLSNSNSILSKVFILKANSSSEIEYLCDSLNQLSDVIYAEPIYREQLLEVPSDPQAQPGSAQGYLEVISAYDAWEISKSDPGIVIGVIDTGADLDHEDLQNKLYQNDDPVNGIDDDGNGFVDDFYGYDFANDDADVNADGNQHGTHVSGIGTAETNNSIGIASVGYHASLSPIKIFTSEANMSNGSYEGVLYAADNDYDIINLSWGSIDTYSQFNQDIINYAVLEKDVVVVAAAGNTPSEVAFYPASYDNVLSVSASNLNDTRASFATYHRKVDLVAPGVSIFSTQNDDTYGSDNGTSHSAPQAAGVAALVKYRYPDLSAVQIMERIRATTDNIYHLTENADLRGKLGKGRLNAYRAVAEQSVVSLRALEPQITGSSGSSFYPGDTLNIVFQVVNYLDPAIEPEFTLISKSQDVSVLTSVQFTGFLSTGDTATLEPFRVVLNELIPAETTLEIALEIRDRDEYSDYQVFNLTTAANAVILTNDSLSIPIDGNGFISKNLTWKNQATLKNSGLSVRVNGGAISDNLPESPDSPSQPSDLIPLHPITPSYGRIEASNILKDTSNLLNIEQNLTIFNEEDNVFATSYTIVNREQDTLKNIEFSLFTDFDLSEASSNNVYLDSALTATTSFNGEFYAGLRPVSEDSIRFLFLDITRLRDSVDEFSDPVISSWLQISSNDSVGFDSPTDVGNFITVLIDSMGPYERKQAHIIWGFSESRKSLLSQLDAAARELDTLAQNPYIEEIFYSCEGAIVEVNPTKGDQYVFYSDPLGEHVIDTANSVFVGPLTTDSLIYASNLDSLYPGKILAYQVNTLNEIAKFSVSGDTLFLGDDPDNRLYFKDESIDPVKLSWDFGNGIQANDISNPAVAFNTTGIYQVTLVVDNSQGCLDTAYREITVLERPAAPEIPEVTTLCPGQPLDFATPSTDLLNLYLTENSKFPAFTDTLIQLSGIEKDTTFFISRIVNGIESHRVNAQIDYQEIDSTIAFSPALDSISPGLLWFYPADPSNQVSRWLINETEFLNQDTAVFSATDTISVTMDGNQSEGCSFINSTEFTFSVSPDPVIEIPAFCAGDDLSISTVPERLLGFYEDGELTRLIRKGNELTVENILADTSIYVVAIDSFIPSNIIELTFSPQIIDYEILANPDSLFLTDGFSVEFSITQPVETIQWYIDSTFQTTSNNPRLFFNNSGDYLITSVATTSAGCQFANSIRYAVYDERPLGLDLANDLLIYPNPVKNFFTVDSQAMVDKIEIFDSSGKLLIATSTTTNRIETNMLKTGWYIIRLYVGDQYFNKKILIE